jgi:hypothetical protein
MKILEQSQKEMATRKCPPGYTRRRGYTRKNTGKRVKSMCIRSTSSYTKPANNTRKRQAARLAAITGAKKSCPLGEIPRAAYVRRITSRVHKRGYTKKTKSGKTIKVYPKSRSIFVPATCVKDMGKPGKLPEGAPIIGPLRKGELKKHGYSYKLPELQRQVALTKAIKEFGPLNTYRKLNAVTKLSQRTSPNAHKIFGKDRNWIRKTYGVSGTLKAFRKEYR